MMKTVNLEKVIELLGITKEEILEIISELNVETVGKQ